MTLRSCALHALLCLVLPVDVAAQATALEPISPGDAGYSEAGLAALAAYLEEAGSSRAEPAPPPPSSVAEPITIGETFTIDSRALGETRRINVYRAPAWGEDEGAARPVLYMPDGGIAEDFLHIAGLLQISTLNGTMRPFLLVGIENTQRRRDMTGPTAVASDREIAPVVGGSAAFRAFIRDELMPEIERRYATTDERAIVGESLAGLFVVETFLLEPDLFDTYIAFDPSLWWNGGALLDGAAARVSAAMRGRTLYLSNSGEPELAAGTTRLAGVLTAGSPARVIWEPLARETHGSLYHPAALRAFRRLFAPVE